MKAQTYPAVTWNNETCDYCEAVNVPLVISYIGAGENVEEEFLCGSCLARAIRATERH